MGLVEVGGNGSVIWRVAHDEGEFGFANVKGGYGKDSQPRKGSGGRFTLVVNGVALADIDVDTSRILILWGRHTLKNVPDATKNVAMKHPLLSRSAAKKRPAPRKRR